MRHGECGRRGLVTDAVREQTPYPYCQEFLRACEEAVTLMTNAIPSASNARPGHYIRSLAGRYEPHVQRVVDTVIRELNEISEAWRRERRDTRQGDFELPLPLRAWMERQYCSPEHNSVFNVEWKGSGCSQAPC